MYVFEPTFHEPSDVYLNDSTMFRTIMASETILTCTLHHKLSKHNIVFINCYMSANVQVAHVVTSRIIINF